MRISSKYVMQITEHGVSELTDECVFEEYTGDVAMCFESGGDGGSYEISDEEKAILQSLTDNMEFFQQLYQTEQLPYDLSILQGNMALFPEYFGYTQSQLEDAQTDLALNREIKDMVADKTQRDIQRQDALSDLEFQRAAYNDDLIQSEIERNDVYNDFIDQQMDWASSYNDYAQYEMEQAKANQAKADAHYDAMVGKSDELSDLSSDLLGKADGAYGDYASVIMQNDAAMQRLEGEKLGMLDADLEGVAGRASADAYHSYETSRDALNREQARLGVNPSSGVAMEQDRLQAMDYAKANALNRTAARDAETTYVENANLERAKANWTKDLGVIGERNNSLGSLSSLASGLYGNATQSAIGSAETLAQAPGSAMEFTKNNVSSSDLLGNSLASKDMNNYMTKSGDLLPYSVTAKDYSAMLNGGYGVMNGYQGVGSLTGGTDFASASSAAGQSAANGPQGVYVPGGNNNVLGSALGAAGTLGAAWLMGG